MGGKQKGVNKEGRGEGNLPREAQKVQVGATRGITDKGTIGEKEGAKGDRVGLEGELRTGPQHKPEMATSGHSSTVGPCEEDVVMRNGVEQDIKPIEGGSSVLPPEMAPVNNQPPGGNKPPDPRAMHQLMDVNDVEALIGVAPSECANMDERGDKLRWHAREQHPCTTEVISVCPVLLFY